MPQRLTQSVAEERVNAICKEIGYSVGEFEYRSFQTKLPLTCSMGHSYKTCSYNNFMKGRRCPICPSAPPPNKFTVQEAERILDELCAEVGYCYGTMHYTTAGETKLDLTCDKGHNWKSTTFASFIKGTRCHKCSCNTRGEALHKFNQEEANDAVLKVCERRGYTVLPFKYIGLVNTILEMKCTCGCEWPVAYRNFIERGSGCPECAGRNQTYAYISVVMDGDEPIALKYGIESTPGLRIQRQNRYTKFDVVRYSTFKFADSNDCKQAELECCKLFQKENFQKFGRSGILEQSKFMDGYTETTDTSNLSKIISIYKDWGAVEITS